MLARRYSLNLCSLKYLVLILCLAFAQKTQACINEYRALLNGDMIFGDVEHASPRGRFSAKNKQDLLDRLHEMDSIYRLSGKLEDYSDYGSMLVYNGEFLKAKHIFLEIEQKHPGLYQTAANLGTTYELLGQNDSALYWIKRAVEINPESHRGSEWIHVKILEAKLKSNGNEHDLWKHSLLNLDFGNNKIPENIDSLDLLKLREHLYDQLNERMSFIQPKDPIIAQLLFDLGNVCALTLNVKSALQVYQTAEEYGYSSDLLSKRQAYFERLQFKADFRNGIEGWARENPGATLLIVGLIILGGLLGSFYFLKRRA